MSDDSQVTQVTEWVERLNAGDPVARERLLEVAHGRLERLASKMLGQFPVVARWEGTEDVLQNALIRLHRALAEVTPPTSRDFFRFAAEQVRRELLQMKRKHTGRQGLGANHASGFEAPHDADVGAGVQPMRDPSDTTHDPARLADWTAFHDAAGRLPEPEREVFDLLFYQGLSQVEAAVVMDVAEKTVQRRWLKARLAISEALGDSMPGF